jgi:hypothetical protein
MRVRGLARFWDTPTEARPDHLKNELRFPLRPRSYNGRAQQYSPTSFP